MSSIVCHAQLAQCHHFSVSLSLFACNVAVFSCLQERPTRAGRTWQAWTDDVSFALLTLCIMICSDLDGDTFDSMGKEEEEEENRNRTAISSPRATRDMRCVLPSVLCSIAMTSFRWLLSGHHRVSRPTVSSPRHDDDGGDLPLNRLEIYAGCTSLSFEGLRGLARRVQFRFKEIRSVMHLIEE